MANNSEFCSGLNRYHVYSSTVNWKPYVGQKIAFKKEHNNPSDKFAVARKVTMKGMVGLIVVGHIPRKLYQYLWFSIREGPKFEADVHKEKPVASPLVQGQWEVLIKVSVTWDEPEKLSILVTKVK